MGGLQMDLQVSLSTAPSFICRSHQAALTDLSLFTDLSVYMACVHRYSPLHTEYTWRVLLGTKTPLQVLNELLAAELPAVKSSLTTLCVPLELVRAWGKVAACSTRCKLYFYIYFYFYFASHYL
jgi:hypothetical protein